MSETGITQGDTASEAVRGRAIALRAQGLTRVQIKDRLSLPSDWAVNGLLDGKPVTHPGLRARAKDDKRRQARDLRTQGWSYKEIAHALGVSISSCSLWLRDVPAPPRPGYDQERVAAMWRKRWEPIMVERETHRRTVKAQAAAEIGELDRRDLLVAGSLICWCEGQKDKSYARREQVRFINSDPDLIRLFLRFLDVVGVERERVRLRVQIHESADADAAMAYWADVAGADPATFQRTTLKRHNPKTVRKNLGDDYHGRLLVHVLQSAELYRRIEGWAKGAMCGGYAGVGTSGRG